MYNSNNAWTIPDLPPGIVCAYLNRYTRDPFALADRWARLDAAGCLGDDPGLTWFEVAEPTVRTFYTDEQWTEDHDGERAVLVYTSSQPGYRDWLNLAIVGGSGGVLWSDWHNNNRDGSYPPPQDSFTHATTGWVVWAMHQLHIAETMLQLTKLHGWGKGSGTFPGYNIV